MLRPSMAMEVLTLGLASLLLLLHVAGAIDDNTSTSCSPARCGNLSITYPFSLSGVQPLYCGYSALELACDAAGRAYLSRTSRQHLYRVENISYDNNSVVVAVEATFAGDATCTVPDFNVSSGLSLLPLNISYTNKNLVFVYDCAVPPSVQLPRPCANHTMGAYVADGDERPSRVPANCSFVSVPVRGFHAGMKTARDRYEGLISDGFLLEWTAAGYCDACKRKGGECRFVEPSFQCFCPDDALLCSTTPRNNGDLHGCVPVLGEHQDECLYCCRVEVGASVQLWQCGVCAWRGRGEREGEELWSRIRGGGRSSIGFEA